jgi:hypothetical protein
LSRVEGYIDSLIKGLKLSESKKEEYKIEFIDHINSLVDEYLEKGYSQTDSIEFAIKDFGSVDLTGLEKDDDEKTEDTSKIAEVKVKRNMRIPIVLVVIFALTITICFSYWINSCSSTPEQAIVKYIKLKSLTSSVSELKIVETEITDSNHNKQFVVTGSKGAFENASFFYVKKDDRGWKVVSAGTGP